MYIYIYTCMYIYIYLRVCIYIYKTYIRTYLPTYLPTYLHTYPLYIQYRRKFRSQTSNNMDRWKSRGEKSPGGEEKEVRRSEKRKREKKEDTGARKRFTVFFQWFVALEGRKVGSLKRRVRNQLARWEMKNCTLLWPEAHFQVETYKTPHLRSTFRSCDVEKVHAVVARSTFSSQNAQSTPCSDHFWKLPCRKKCTLLRREAHFQLKNVQSTPCWDHFWKLIYSKVHAVVARSTLLKTDTLGPLFDVQMSKSVRRCGAKPIWESKVSKTKGFEPFLTFSCRKKKCTLTNLTNLTNVN